MKVTCIVFSLLCLPIIVFGKHNTVTENISKAWDVTWTRFYHPRTHLFYDYISSYEKGEELNHLPKAHEVKLQYPNPCGYGTGMEDCMILGGTMLNTLVDMYNVTQNNALATKSTFVFEGLKLASDIPEASGFVARGICPDDGVSYYINSSRDQYTHNVYGLWSFFHSPLSTPAQRIEIKHILSKIAERMTLNVIPENNYDFLRADNQQCPLGICRMWNVEAHEAARLPMIYAAAWDVTGDDKYYKLYRNYIYEAINQSKGIHTNYSAYVFLQMAYSFDLLYKLETDASLKIIIADLMLQVENMSFERAKRVKEKLLHLDEDRLHMLGPDWRVVETWDVQKGYNIPRWGEYRNVWHAIREIGESLTVAIMLGDEPLKDEKVELLNEIISFMEYDRCSSCGVVFHLSAYWKAKCDPSFIN